MSYWSKRRKILKNVEKHLSDINEENKTNILEQNWEQSSSANVSDREHVSALNSESSETVDNHNSDSDDNCESSETVNLSETDIPVIGPHSCNSTQDFSEYDTPYYLLSDSDEEVNEVEIKSFKEQLKDWALEFDIPLNALSKLLSILRPEISDLPKDPRTLLSTKVNYEIKNMCGGEYYHFGMSEGIKHILSTEPDLDILTKNIQIQLNMDGLPLFRSSSSQFWPILARLVNVGMDTPFIVGLFYGNSKPSNVADYLKPLIDELTILMKDGLIYMEHAFRILVSSVICDSPAKAFIKNVKQYSGYHGCDKCSQNGVWEGKMTYPEVDAELRSDSDFERMSDEDHHKGPSPLVGTIGMVSKFPIDYMHLVCLGVMKRLILMWLKGPLKVRIGSFVSNQISDDLFNLRHFIPCEFARRPRGFSHIDRWKATEYRQFLLYTGPVVLQHKLDEIVYQNFLLLSVSIHILLNPYLAQQYNDYCKILLKSFVQHYSQLYGSENVVYNVHGLVHLPDDAKNFGSLDTISSFPFENYLMTIKKMVRKPSFPLQQIVRRLSERKLCRNPDANLPSAENERDNPAPVPVDFNGCPQFKSVRLGKFRLDLRRRDRYFRLDNTICQLENVIMKDGDIYVAYRKYEELQNYFMTPLPSELLGIYTVANLSDSIIVNKIDQIQSKYIVLSYKGNDIAMPFTDSIW